MKIVLEDRTFDVRVTAKTRCGRANWHLTVERGGTVVRELDVAESPVGAFDLCRQNVTIEIGLDSLFSPAQGRR